MFETAVDLIEIDIKTYYRLNSARLADLQAAGENTINKRTIKKRDR